MVILLNYKAILCTVHWTHMFIYPDTITVWASGPEIINSYLRDVGIYLKENSAPKSTVTLFTPDTHQFQMHQKITLDDTQLPLECSPKILGVIMDPSLSFHKHCNYVTDRIDKTNNMLKVLAGSSWGNMSQAMLHQSGASTQVTRALRYR